MYMFDGQLGNAGILLVVILFDAFGRTVCPAYLCCYQMFSSMLTMTYARLFYKSHF